MARDNESIGLHTGYGIQCGKESRPSNWNVHMLKHILQIWISPITAQLPQITKDLSSYHGYWQQDLYVVNANFGTEEDIQNLSKALHDRGMYLMVDIVANHMASATNYTDIQYTDLWPFDNPSYYHFPYCSVNDSGANPLTVC